MEVLNWHPSHGYPQGTSPTDIREGINEMARLANRIFLPIWPDMKFASVAYVNDYESHFLIGTVAHCVLEYLRILEHKREPCDRIIHIIVKDPSVSVQTIKDEIQKIEEWVEVRGQMWFTVSLNVNHIVA